MRSTAADIGYELTIIATNTGSFYDRGTTLCLVANARDGFLSMVPVPPCMILFFSVNWDQL